MSSLLRFAVAVAVLNPGAAVMPAGIAGALPSAAVDGAASADDPLTRPMAADRAAEWLAPLPPQRVFGRTYLVGFGGLSVALIDTGAGLVLIDAALPQAAPAILANVRKLGFDPKDIKFILSTEPHYDHSGGIAALVRATGAVVVASVQGAEGLRGGRHAADDPQHGYGGTWPAVAQVRTVRDGDRVTLGRTSITAHATPGHTMGSMSWSWTACEGRSCRQIAFASSLNPVSAPGYRFTDSSSAPLRKGFAASYRRMEALRCDILIAAHPDNAGAGRYASAPGSCHRYVERARRLLHDRLAAERKRP